MNAANAHADTERRESLIDLLLWEKRVTLLEHRAQVGPDGVRNHPVPGGVRVKRVVEVELVVSDDAQEKKRHEPDFIALGHPRVHAMKLERIAQPGKRRRFHLTQQYGDAARLSALDHGRDIALDRRDRHTAQAVVDADREDDDPGIWNQGPVEAKQGFGGRVSSHAGVDHAVITPLGCDALLKQGRVGLFGTKPGTRGQAVAERHDDWRSLAGRRRALSAASDCCTSNEQRNRKPSHTKIFARAMPVWRGTHDARKIAMPLR